MNFIMMALILASRMAGALMLFVILARGMNIADFGFFSASYGVAAVLTIIVDFGFSQSLLRDIARNPEMAGEYINDGLSLKVILSLIVFLFLSLHSVISGIDRNFFITSGLVIYFIGNSFCEFYGAALRAHGDYKFETYAQFSFTLLLLGAAFFSRGDLLLLVAAMVGLVFFRLVAMHAICKKLIYRWKVCLNIALERVSVTFKKNFSYALDQGVGILSTNADLIFVSYFLGPIPTAIYQAGQKIVQGISSSAMIFANIYLPKLSKDSREPREALRISAQMTVAMLACGLVSASAIYFMGEFISNILYGDKFKGLFDLLPAFSLLIIIRYFTAIIGIHLTAFGMQKARTISNIICLLFFVFSCAYMLKNYQLVGVIYSLILSSSIQAILYSFGLVNALKEIKSKKPI